jgi:Predicted membrane protein
MNNLPSFLRICFGTRINRLRFFLYGLFMMIFLIAILVVIVTTILMPLMATIHGSPTPTTGFSFFPVFMSIFFFNLCFIFFGWSYSLSLMVRRLHDLNKSWTWIFILFIPLVNFLFYLYLLFAKGTVGSNRFGDDPLEYDSYGEYLDSQNIVE